MKVFKNDKLIAGNVKKADGFLSRLKGLMFKSKLKEEEGLLLFPCNSVHTFFMFFPIHVIMLDRNHKIIDINKNVFPNRIIPPVEGVQYVLELSTDRDLDLQNGDKLKFK